MATMVRHFLLSPGQVYRTVIVMEIMTKVVGMIKRTGAAITIGHLLSLLSFIKMTRLPF